MMFNIAASVTIGSTLATLFTLVFMPTVSAAPSALMAFVAGIVLVFASVDRIIASANQ